MLVTNTFASKCNTIVEGSRVNTGLNPILQLYYGNMHTRGLIYFDTDKVRQLIQNGTYSTDNLKHTLKMWNVSDINVPGITKRFPDSYLTDLRERATSYDLLLLKADMDWDAGRGFDFSEVKTYEGYRGYSEHGSNWYNATQTERWTTPGVYNTEDVLDELEHMEADPAYVSEFIIASQHFDFGNEPLELDITTIFNYFIDNPNKNHGFVLMFSPRLERTKQRISQYSGFFTNTTNTFFEPYVQTTCLDTIQDDRSSFYLDKDNRLYFYSNIGGNYENLDYTPTCTIDGADHTNEVTQQSKGVYYVIHKISSENETAPKTHYDKWEDISYNGIQYPPVQLRFTTYPNGDYMQFGLPFDTERKPRYDVTLSGVNRDEKVPQGETRRLTVHVRAPYTSDQEAPYAQVDYRLYAMFDNKEMNVIDWYPVDKEYTTYVIPISTDNFVPQVYHIDLRVKYGNEIITKQDAARFEIVSIADKMKS